MFLEVTNLGRLQHAKVNLSKRLIIFTGENNTGKTYLSYLINGISTHEAMSIMKPIGALEEKAKEIYSKNIVEFDAIEIFKEHGSKIFERASEAFKELLPDMLAVPSDSLKNTTIKLSWEFEDFNAYMNTFALLNSPILLGGNFEISRAKELNTGKYFFQLNNRDKGGSQPLTEKSGFHRFILNYMLSDFLGINYAQFIPAERIGISIFAKEIFQNRFDLTTQANRLKGAEIGEFYRKHSSLYPNAINDALRNEQRVGASNTPPDQEGFEALADELEQKILNGKLRALKNNDIEFVVDENAIKIQAAGSTVKSLSSLVFHLRKSRILDKAVIIDEPEINLHPDNQRLIARIIAKMVNLGVQVIMSTHSDYILRELNNLIMLGSDTAAAKELAKKYSYEDMEILKHEKVAAYLFKKNKDNNYSSCEEISLSDEGVQVETINAVINNQNKVAFDIFQRLQDEKDAIKP